MYLGNGVSDLIVMTLQGLLNPGDEVLVPSPDYPLWTGAVNLGGGRAVHYRCAEDLDWNPDVEHVESLVTPLTRALVIINPNNPTGAVYSREALEGLLDVARRHDLLVLADEIYDQILFDDAVHYCAAALAPDLPVLTMGGMSKTYRLAGFRSGWLVISGPRGADDRVPRGPRAAGQHADVPQRPGPARDPGRTRRRHRHQAAAAAGRTAARPAGPGLGDADPRSTAWTATSRPARSTCSPRLDPGVHKISDDERMCIDFLEQQHVLLTHGTGFNLPSTDHIRVVFLAPVEVLSDAVTRLGEFLATYRQ